MSFKLKLEELTYLFYYLSELFNPDNVHRGVSLDKLKKLGKIPALEGLLKTNFNVKPQTRRKAYLMIKNNNLIGDNFMVLIIPSFVNLKLFGSW